MSAGFSIFYSWQSDTPGAVNRQFIRSCLNQAIELLNAEALVEDAARVDSGMEGIAGTPEVASVMFEKIEASSLFLGDVTLIGSSRFDAEKLLPNPNVSIETGYAAHALGWDRIIRVMNEHFGSRESLPFDERNRRFPITYKLGQIEDDPDGEIRSEFTNNLVGALRSAEASELRKVERARQRLDVGCLQLIYEYRNVEYFAEPNPMIEPEKASAIGPLFERTIPRLLDLGLLFANQGEDGSYAYHWTYLGKRVSRKLFPEYGGA